MVNRLKHLLLTAALCLVPLSAHATIDLSEDFEEASNTALVAIWSSNCDGTTMPGNMELSTTRAHGGTQSLKLTYPAPDSSGGCNINRALSAPTDVFFMRVWAFFDNFSNNTGVGTKMWFAGQNNAYPNFWGETFSGPLNWGMVITNTLVGGDGNFGGGAVPANQWVCLEYQITMNTPGIANGIWNAWVNGTLVGSRTNLLLRGSTDNGQFNTPNSQIAFVETYRQHGVGTIYYDDYAASRNAQIGCGGAPPPPSDTIPPTVVTSLAGSVNASGNPVLTWVNGTDNVGVAGQNIRRCTGAACVPTTVYASLSGLNTTYTDLAAIAGTTYGYAVNDVDAAGNQGAYSATVSVTSTSVNTTRTTTASDSFIRANAPNLGANWTPRPAHDPIQIVSNAGQATTLGQNAAEYYSVAAPPNDQWAQQTLTAFSSAVSASACVILRYTDGNNFMDACAGNTNPSLLIRKKVAGVNTTLLSDNSQTWTVNDVLRFTAQGASYCAYRNDVLTGACVADTALVSGFAGLELFVDVGGTLADVAVSTYSQGGYTASPPAITAVVASSTGATVTWNTVNVPTQIRVATGTNAGQFSSQIYPISSFPGGVFSNIWIGGLTYACFYAIDASGVENGGTNAFVCVSLVGVAPNADTTPIVLSNVQPSVHLPAGTTSTTISASLNKPGTCRYGTSDPAGTDLAAYNSLPTAMTVSSLTASATVSGLTNGSTTTYYIRCDFQNTLLTDIPNPTSTVVTVIVDASTPDVVAPSTVTGLTSTVLGQTQATLSWNAATAHGTKTIGGYYTYSCFLSNCSDAVLNSNIVVPATTTILNLLPGTTYYFCVKAVDSANVLSAACSNIPAAITTGAIAKTQPPSDMTNLQILGLYASSVVLISDPGTSIYGAVTTTIELSTTGCGGPFTLVYSNLALQAFVNNLIPSTAYCVRGKFSDGTNVSVHYSNTVSFTTPIAGLSTPRAFLPFGAVLNAATRSARP